MSPERATPIGGRRLLHDSAWNLLGNAAPLLAALVCIPFLVRGLGAERFGFLTVAWALVGYFNLFDLGISRAATRLVATRLEGGDRAGVGAAAGSGLALVAALGLVGGAALILTAPWLCTRVLAIPATLAAEAIASVRVLGVAVVLTLATVGVRGVLEAYRRFRPLGVIRMTLGSAQFVGAALVLPFSTSLVVMVIVLAVIRLLALAAHLALLRGALAADGVRLGVRRADVRALVGFGGWLTVSNAVGPVMVYFDRFFVGATLGMTAVAHYATPGEIVQRLAVVPEALLGVLYPALAASVPADRRRATALRDWGLKLVLFAMLPMALVLAAFAGELLALWLGAAFAHGSAQVLQILAAGMLVNSIARVYNTTLQASGRPDLAAKIHLVELPVYLGALWVAATRFGIEGVAWVWAGRALVDLVLLRALSNALLAESGMARRTLVTLTVGLAGIGLAAAMPSAASKLAAVAALGAGVGLWCWRALLGQGEREVLATWVRLAGPGRRR
jgi:O-antigen/teichoic acid export membrane protein